MCVSGGEAGRGRQKQREEHVKRTGGEGPLDLRKRKEALQNLLERGGQAGHRGSSGAFEPDSLTDLVRSATQGIFGWEAHPSPVYQRAQSHWDPFRAQYLCASEALLPLLSSVWPCLLNLTVRTKAQWDTRVV